MGCGGTGEFRFPSQPLDRQRVGLPAQRSRCRQVILYAMCWNRAHGCSNGLGESLAPLLRIWLVPCQAHIQSWIATCKFSPVTLACSSAVWHLLDEALRIADSYFNSIVSIV